MTIQSFFLFKKLKEILKFLHFYSVHRSAITESLCNGYPSQKKAPSTKLFTYTSFHFTLTTYRRAGRACFLFLLQDFPHFLFRQVYSLVLFRCDSVEVKFRNCRLFPLERDTQDRYPTLHPWKLNRTYGLRAKRCIQAATHCGPGR